MDLYNVSLGAMNDTEEGGYSSLKTKIKIKMMVWHDKEMFSWVGQTAKFGSQQKGDFH